MDEISFISGRDRCAAWHFDAIDDAFAGTRGVQYLSSSASRRATNTTTDWSRQ